MQENSTGKALGWESSEVVDIRAQHRFERRSTSVGRHGRQGDQQKWVEELDCPMCFARDGLRSR